MRNHPLFYVLVVCSTLITSVGKAQQDLLVVVDVLDSIYRFDGLDGSFEGVFGDADASNGGLDSPRDIAISPSGNVYVSNSHTREVREFDSQGNHLGVFGDATTTVLSGFWPWSLEFNATGDLFVTARTSGGRIAKFDSEGNFDSYIGSDIGDEFGGPSIAIDSNNRLFVTSQPSPTDPETILHYSSSGSALGVFGDASESIIGLRTINGDITFDSNGILHVTGLISSYSGTGNVFQFDQAGDFLGQYGDPGGTPLVDGGGDLGTVFDESGRLFVSASGNRAVRFFDGAGIFQGVFGEAQRPGTLGNDFQPNGLALIPTLNTQPVSLDFGDAPASYQTLLDADGPRHAASGPTLGAARDLESDGNPDAAATGDDTDSIDDEDGVSFVPATGFDSNLPTGNSINLSIVGAPADYEVWIDWNQDGDFLDAEELESFGNIATDGEHSIAITIPAAATTGTMFVRVRLYGSGTALGSPVGYASSGEVEDYLISHVEANPTPRVVDRWIFYNESSYDNDEASLNESDDAAIATDKSPLLDGQLANFANYTSYSKGINGIIVDIADLPGLPIADDFVFKVGNSQDVSSWVLAPEPTAISIRQGQGIDGADRISIRWDNNAIEKQWLQVTVKSSAATGLSQDDVFYFGNAIGETGNASILVNISDENGARQNPRNFLDPAPITDAYDFNRDEAVDVSDENIARQNSTNFLTALAVLDLTQARGTRKISALLRQQHSKAEDDAKPGERSRQFGHPFPEPSPRLSIESSLRDSAIVIRTIGGDATGFLLETAENVFTPTWKPVPTESMEGIDTIEGQAAWRIRTSERVQFFRLRK